MAGIERILARYGVPREIQCLPFVESMFNDQARSKVGASGIWQFTRDTGRRYLRIDAAVDSRHDVWLATDGAARLLRDNFAKVSSWPRDMASDRRPSRCSPPEVSSSSRSVDMRMPTAP